MTKRALITGISGQDGAYLAKLLLEQGYEVFGGNRRTSSNNKWRLHELGILDDIRIIPLELLEMTNVMRVIEMVRPDELYNLAAQSAVSVSFEQPIYTAEVNALGTAKILEALRVVHPGCRFYQASTSEMFGKVAEVPQSERTPFHPRSPYAIAKLYAHFITVNYRESYGMFALAGILFNHESPFRGLEFVTRKITHGLARIRYGAQETVELGNLEGKRDWGYAEDYVRGMWLMLQQDNPDDYVLATGKNHSVLEFTEKAAEAMGFSLEWEGQDQDKKGIDRRNGKTIIRVNPELFRPAEVDALVGDASKAQAKLGWRPNMPFDQLVATMVRADMDRIAAVKS